MYSHLEYGKWWGEEKGRKGEQEMLGELCEILVSRMLANGTSPLVQCLGLHASTAGGAGLISGWGTKILHAAWCGHKKTKQTNKWKKQEKKPKQAKQQQKQTLKKKRMVA